jgi:hypothetical protein
MVVVVVEGHIGRLLALVKGVDLSMVRTMEYLFESRYGWTNIGCVVHGVTDSTSLPGL